MLQVAALPPAEKSTRALTMTAKQVLVESNAGMRSGPE